ncbi:MAG: SufD family Fe-S cluster assembly protein [Bacteroidales bacterium]|nr:SufD family Fe-S cluster assembly protein [Bacteroidales bacterium]
MDSNNSSHAGAAAEPLRPYSAAAKREWTRPDSGVRPAVIVVDSSIKRECVVGEGETLDVTFIVLPGTSAEVNINVDITGPGATVDLKGIYLSHGSDKVVFNVSMNHHSGGSVSRQLFNGLAAGAAKCSFFGKIVVAQDAQKTEAYQENHNIVLSDNALVNTKPQLEIYADDVKCSHGATVGKLNEDEQFYMRSRGIPEDEAKVLQMISFVAPVLSGVQDEELASRIEAAIRSLAKTETEIVR